MRPPSCSNCGEQLELSTKVYFEIDKARWVDGTLELVSLRVSAVNDSIDGNPCALESEARVICRECGQEVETFRFSDMLEGERIARAPYAVTPEGEVIR